MMYALERSDIKVLVVDSVSFDRDHSARLSGGGSSCLNGLFEQVHRTGQMKHADNLTQSRVRVWRMLEHRIRHKPDEM